MLLFIVGFAGFGLGAWVVFMLVERRRTRAAEDRRAGEARWAEVKDSLRKLDVDGKAVAAAQAVLEHERKQFDARSITLRDLEAENRSLKREMLNLDIQTRKLSLDRKEQAGAQIELDRRSHELAERYLSEVGKWVAASINANNFSACKQRLLKAVEWSRKLGYEVSAAKEAELIATLKEDFEREVKAALEREEQARIKAQIREEQQRQREVERELQNLERERAAIKAALDKAMADARGAHSEEVERLKARLADAEAKAQRAVSQAQLTRAGHIYIISNLGSFGENVFKIGMTRRLDPQDRVDELGSASVPFPFDIHMMISCSDAPALENALHREFFKHRINKVNPRKEFFRIDLDQIRKFVEARHGDVRYVADAEALQYRQSAQMSDDDHQYIEGVFRDAEGKLGMAEVED